MSTERWDDDKLDRLASMVESNARVIQALANVAAEAREEREQLFQRMDRQQAEIVGLRTETVRMLDILLNQRNQGDSPTA
jgi:Cu/Ag efflux pump CusA